MLGHASVFVTEQLLRMPKVAGVAGSLGPDVSKLKAYARGFARLSKPRRRASIVSGRSSSWMRKALWRLRWRPLMRSITVARSPTMSIALGLLPKKAACVFRVAMLVKA